LSADWTDHWIDWDLMKSVYELPDAWFEIPLATSQRNFVFDPENYEDAVVVPWHDPSQEAYKNVCCRQVYASMTWNLLTN